MEKVHVWSSQFERINTQFNSQFTLENPPFLIVGQIVRVIEFSYETKRKTGRMCVRVVTQYDVCPALEGFDDLVKITLSM